MKYFQHDLYARENGKLWKVIKIHGATGYGVWWALLEEIYKNEDKGFQVSADMMWMEPFADALRLSDERVLIRILDTFADVGLIDAQLWHEKAIYTPSVVERGNSYIKKKSDTKERVKRWREEQRRLQEEGLKRTSNALHPECNASVTPNIEVEVEVENLKGDLGSISISDMRGELIGNSPEVIQIPLVECSGSGVDIAVKPEVLGEDEDCAPRKKTRQEYFDDFWSVFPRKVGKPAAEKAFSKVPDGVLPLLVPKVLEQKEAYRQQHAKGWQFFPHPSTWLNQCRWDSVEEEYDSRPVMTKADERAFTQMANLKAHLLAKQQVQK